MTLLPFRLLTLAIAILAGLFVFDALRTSRRKRALLRQQYLVAGEAVPTMLQAPLWPWGRAFAGAVVMASFYLLLFRGLSFLPTFKWDHEGGAILMSFSFLCLGPFLAGYITVWHSAQEAPFPKAMWILAPWIPLAINIVLAISFVWEGLICVIFIVPPAMISASLGGVTAGLLHRYRHKRTSGTTMLCLALAPLLLAVVETQVTQPLRIRTVNTSLVIHAPVTVVWRNIERVPAIGRGELRPSWANAIGFPRPVEATLSHEGVGGVRNASFERGLNFTETITEWLPGKRIAFTIAADTAGIPSTTLDAHVTVGGRFFDVLTGEYDLESLPGGDTLLHLSSRQRLSTDFNAYAALWSDAVMSDMQNNILHVVRNRCETEARSDRASVTINNKGY